MSGASPEQMRAKKRCGVPCRAGGAQLATGRGQSGLGLQLRELCSRFPPLCALSCTFGEGICGRWGITQEVEPCEGQEQRGTGNPVTLRCPTPALACQEPTYQTNHCPPFSFLKISLLTFSMKCTQVLLPQSIQVSHHQPTKYLIMSSQNIELTWFRVTEVFLKCYRGLSGQTISHILRPCLVFGPPTFLNVVHFPRNPVFLPPICHCHCLPLDGETLPLPRAKEALLLEGSLRIPEERQAVTCVV